MDGHYDSQKELHSKIQACFRTLKDKPVDEQTKGAGEAQLSRLEHHFASSEEIHIKVSKYRSKNSEHVYFTSNIMDSIEDFYYIAKGQFNDFFHEVHSREASKIPDASLDLTLRGEQIPSLAYKRLPIIPLDPFSGKHSDWEKFRDQYRGLVHRCEKLSVIDKLLFLRANVKGKALEIVNRYPIADANYESAWTDLVNYYENPRRLVQTHTSRLFAAKPMKSESYSSLNKLYEEIFNPLNSLQALKRPVDQWADLIVLMATSRISMLVMYMYILLC